MATVGGLILVMPTFIFYLLPAIISSEWHTKHFDAILFTHPVLGWTVFGWIAPLI
ncbi:MAG: superinfection immunity protein [Deltaproteobacteria bacterium]|nr:MAG: superinfection immunity protein [Deltaproteobacteria bacterium]